MIERSSQTPAAGVSHVDALPPGTRLAEFEILGLLGVGGFGMVYKAFDHSLHRAVAIKEYMPTALAGACARAIPGVRSSSDQQTFQAGLASFVGEARLLAQFDHPSLVKVFRFWEANNTAYMVMPLYSGMTFKQARAQMRTPPPEAWLRKVLWSVLGRCGCCTTARRCTAISRQTTSSCKTMAPRVAGPGAARHAINDQGASTLRCSRSTTRPSSSIQKPMTTCARGPGAICIRWRRSCMAACAMTRLCRHLAFHSRSHGAVPRIAKTVKRQFGVEYSPAFVAAVTQALFAPRRSSSEH